MIKFEILCADVPGLVINEIYAHNSSSLHVEIEKIKKKNLENLKKLDAEKVCVHFRVWVNKFY